MKLIASLSMLAVVVLAGCKTVNTVERAVPVNPPTPLDDRRVITDTGLGRIAQVVRVNQSVVSGDLLRIDVDIFNNGSTQQRFNYVFEWFDQDGMAVFTPMSRWQGRIIEGKEMITLTGIAPNPRAKDFRLKLQESKR